MQVVRLLALRAFMTAPEENNVNEEEERLAKEMLARLPEELREPFEEAARLDGSTLEEYVLALVRDMEKEGLLDAAADDDVSEEEFLRLVFVGDCPSCGSENTICCDEFEDIDDPTVGLCNECGYFWCLECGSAQVRGETCGHWDVCDRCDEEKDEFEDCGIMPSECPRVLEWIAEEYALASQGSCAWCGAAIPEFAEVYAVGAKLKGGIEFRAGNGDAAFFMPVTVAGRLVPAIVTGQGSDARAHGDDLMFMTCSEACASDLRDALREEKELVERAELN